MDTDTNDVEDYRDLVEYLADDLPAAVETGGTPGGTPLDSSLANRYLRRLALLSEAEEEDRRIAEREIERIREWVTLRKERIDRQRRFYETSLEAFARNSFELTGVRTLDLPSGTLRLRASRSNVVVASEEKFIEWATDNAPDLLRVKTEVDKTAVGKLSTTPIAEPIAELIREDRPDLTAQLADCEISSVLLDGERIPGVVIAKRILDSFSASPKVSGK